MSSSNGNTSKTELALLRIFRRDISLVSRTGLNIKHFSSYPKAWDVFSTLNKDGIPATDSVLRANALSDDLINSIGFLPDKEVISRTVVEELSKKLKMSWAKRESIKVTAGLNSRLESGDIDINTYLSLLDSGIRRIKQQIYNSSLGINLKDSVNQANARIREAITITASKAKIEFPFPTLRRAMPSLRKGNLFTILTDPGIGKTAFLEDMSEYWASLGFNVVYFDNELPEDTREDRRIQRRAGVSQIDLDSPKMLTKDQLESISKASLAIKAWTGNIQYVYCVGWTIEEIIATAEILNDVRPWHNERPVDIVILDYLNRVPVNPEIGVKVSTVVNSYKTFLGKNGFVGGLAAQFDKASMNKGGNNRSLDNAIGTSVIAQVSNIGLVINREKDKDTGEYSLFGKLGLVKANAGKMTVVDVLFNESTMKFREINQNGASNGFL